MAFPSTGLDLKTVCEAYGITSAPYSMSALRGKKHYSSSGVETTIPASGEIVIGDFRGKNSASPGKSVADVYKNGDFFFNQGGTRKSFKAIISFTNTTVSFYPSGYVKKYTTTPIVSISDNPFNLNFIPSKLKVQMNYSKYFVSTNRFSDILLTPTSVPATSYKAEINADDLSIGKDNEFYLTVQFEHFEEQSVPYNAYSGVSFMRVVYDTSLLQLSVKSIS